MRKLTAAAILIALAPGMAQSADRSTAGRGHPAGPGNLGRGDAPGSTPGNLPGPARPQPGAAPNLGRSVPLFPGLAPWASSPPGRGQPRITLPKPGSGSRLSTEDLRRSLRARGYRDLSDVQVRGDNYVVHAIGPRGERVTLVVNAATSEILGSRVRGE